MAAIDQVDRCTISMTALLLRYSSDVFPAGRNRGQRQADVRIDQAVGEVVRSVFT